MVNLIPAVKEGEHGKPISLHKRVLQILKKDLAIHLKYIPRTEYKITAEKEHFLEKSRVCQVEMSG